LDLTASAGDSGDVLGNALTLLPRISDWEAKRILFRVENAALSEIPALPMEIRRCTKHCTVKPMLLRSKAPLRRVLI
jgi:hypothetical protein